MKKVETKWGVVTVPELADLPLANYPHIRDEVDLMAYEAYARGGFHPPQRPEGWLDEGEKACWERWREAVKERGLSVQGAPRVEGMK